MTPRDAESELSRLRVDGVTEILGVALGVLEDHAPDHGDTRLERLARFVLLNMRAEVMHEKCGDVSCASVGSPTYFAVGQCMSTIGITSWPVITGAKSALGPFTPTHARELATALLMCADHADNPVES